MRIVSLVPSSTETLLGLGANVVACTRFCEQPDLPVVGGTKNPDVAAIVALEPDLVVMDVEENRREDADALSDQAIPVMATNVVSVDDAKLAVAALAAAAGVEAPKWSLPAPSDVATAAIVPIWRRPWMLLGEDTYGASLLAHLGVRVVAPEGRYPQIDLDVGERSMPEPPDLILVPSEPYRFTSQHHSELREAFPNSRLVEVDGQDLFWWGIRTPDALMRLADVAA